MSAPHWVAAPSLSVRARLSHHASSISAASSRSVASAPVATRSASQEACRRRMVARVDVIDEKRQHVASEVEGTDELRLQFRVDAEV